MSISQNEVVTNKKYHSWINKDALRKKKNDEFEMKNNIFII